MTDVKKIGVMIIITDGDTEPRIFIDAKPVYRFIDGGLKLSFNIGDHIYEIPLVKLTIEGETCESKEDALNKLSEMFGVYYWGD